ncbi:MAG: FAD-binding oxidoreductase, partial [Woeseia sp.]
NCTLGGNVSTNAGGTKVIRFGMTRDSVLGIEVVLADGTVLSSMNRYIKNNSGFDLKQLFIGTEGVLGAVTRVIMRQANKPQTHNVALVACGSYNDTVRVLNEVRARLGAALCGFEVMWNSFYERVVQPVGRQPALIPPGQYCYVLIEAMGSNSDFDDDVFAATMEALLTSGCVSDGVLAKSGQERDAMWAVRHDVEWIVSGAQNFDISLRIADVGAYVESLTQELRDALPTAHVAAFGHLGDNNLHISVVGDYSISERDVVEYHVYHLLKPYAGAISAEHGIGLEKRGWLPLSRTSNEIATMRALKRTLDPRNILNPGKVVGPP